MRRGPDSLPHRASNKRKRGMRGVHEVVHRRLSGPRARTALPALALLLSLDCAAQSAATTLRFDRLGPYRLGMPLARAAALASGGLHATPVPLRQSENCDYLPADAGNTTYLMFENDVLSRIDIVAGHAVKTASGIGIGSPLRALRRAYPHATTWPIYGDERDIYYTVRTARGAALRFEVHDGRVRAFYAGTRRAVEYTEQCL
jgi:hypothetical protein